MFCCEQLDGLIAQAGQRGFSVVPREEAGLRYFCLEARACDWQDEPRMRNIPPSCDVPRPLTIAMQIGIQYCPGCGARLEPIIAAHERQFAALLQKCEAFILGKNNRGN